MCLTSKDRLLQCSVEAQKVKLSSTDSAALPRRFRTCAAPGIPLQLKEICRRGGATVAFSDLLGTQLVLSRDYGMEELYELIRDQLFDAGRPRLEPGVSAHIVFPTQEDRGRVVIRGAERPVLRPVVRRARSPGVRTGLAPLPGADPENRRADQQHTPLIYCIRIRPAPELCSGAGFSGWDQLIFTVSHRVFR